ncbi:MAG: hypothetical protein JO262_08025 [Solirubrobacterales bacterium]|nr:hypothetical protein [Solirubrobacterales bacterium]
MLKATTREISTLSPTLRSAWDGRPLALLTRTAPAHATDAHISIIGHITASELRHHTTRVELVNGFINRFVLVAVPVARGRQPRPAQRLRSYPLPRQRAQTRADGRASDTRPRRPRELWWNTYPHLTQPGDGLAGQVLARAEAHTIRLALIYALLDAQRHIQPTHLQAALALWDYAVRSATWARGQATGDPLAEQIHAALVRSPDGLTRTQISHLLHRNLPVDQLSRALHALAATGRAHPQETHAAGPPHRAVDRPPTTRDLRHGHTLSPTGLEQSNRAGRRGLSPSEARERKRSDLDSHPAGATIIQVQAARGLAAARKPAART